MVALIVWSDGECLIIIDTEGGGGVSRPLETETHPACGMRTGFQAAQAGWMTSMGPTETASCITINGAGSSRAVRR